ncbi:putative S-acyltransferase [Acorus gramineus]|uniref:S-acyltransferase n=1 Tax=Acorus gramineus TaxID=55184 RepID=A0AAV9B8K5_ACOGR|nr:putative S-acyltransferase [Acorus gramineus]
MTMVEICRPVTAAWASLLERCSLHFPCLSDPDRRTSVILKASLVLVHLVIIGLLFVLDEHLQRKTQKEPWYTAIYLVLFVATLVQYFYTSGSTPGYVVDAMRVYNDTRHAFLNTSRSSEQSASSIMGSSISSVGGRASGKSISGAFTTMWVKQVMALYPPGSSTSLHEQSIVMIVTNVFFSLIIIVFGWEPALDEGTIVDFGSAKAAGFPSSAYHLDFFSA